MNVPHRDALSLPADNRCSRRSFLLSLLVGALAAAGCGEQDSPPGGSVSVAKVPPAWLPAAVGDLGAAARVGRAYLEGQTAEQNLGRLLDAIDAALGPELGSDETGTRQVLDALQRAVRSEYRRGDTVAAGGWVLSRTEARVYAVLALLESG